MIPELNSSLKSSVKVESIQKEVFLVNFVGEVLLPGMDLGLEWNGIYFLYGNYNAIECTTFGAIHVYSSGNRS